MYCYRCRRIHVGEESEEISESQMRLVAWHLTTPSLSQLGDSKQHRTLHVHFHVLLRCLPSIAHFKASESCILALLSLNETRLPEETIKMRSVRQAAGEGSTTIEARPYPITTLGIRKEWKEHGVIQMGLVLGRLQD